MSSGTSGEIQNRGKSCLYIKKLADVDVDVLRELVTLSVNKMAAKRIHK